MTNAEAIETLKLLKPNMRFDNSGWLYTKQALDMAINALSSWEEYSDKLWKEAYERGKTEALSQEPTVDVLDKIRDEIERLHYHPKLDFIKNDEVVEMALDIIDKYRNGENE